KLPTSDPLPLLLSEIDILLAQARLVELYLKQSQAAALFERQRERERHSAEAAELRAALAQSEQALATIQQGAEGREQGLREQARRLEAAIDEIRREIRERDAALDRAEAANAELRAELRQSEEAGAAARTAAQRFHDAERAWQSEIAALHARLEEKQGVLENERRAAVELSEAQQSRLVQLQAELRASLEKARFVEEELLRGRGALQETQARIAEIEGRREQDRAEQASELERALDESRRSAEAAERELRNEISALRGRLEENHQSLESRNHELGRAQAEIAALGARAGELEKHAAALAEARAEEIASLRLAHENELAELRHEVARRERALTERQEAVSAVELALHGKIQALQGELARSRAALAEQESAAQRAQGEMAALSAELERAEARRRELEAERAQLQEELGQARSSALENESRRAAVEAELSGENQRLHLELAAQRSTAEGFSAETARVRAEIAALVEKQARAEEIRDALEREREQEARARRELENRLQAKEAELRALDERQHERVALALQEQESRFKTLDAERLREIAALQDRVQGREFAEQQSHAEIIRLHGAIADLETQRTALENSCAELRRGLEQAEASCREAQARAQSIAAERQRQLDDWQERLDEQSRSGQALAEELDRARAERALAEEKAGRAASWSGIIGRPPQSIRKSRRACVRRRRSWKALGPTPARAGASSKRKSPGCSSSLPKSSF